MGARNKRDGRAITPDIFPAADYQTCQQTSCYQALGLIGLTWLGSSKPSSPIVNSKPNQAVIDGWLDRLDRLDSSEHVTCSDLV